jgi:hypothetical protein
VRAFICHNMSEISVALPFSLIGNSEVYVRHCKQYEEVLRFVRPDGGRNEMASMLAESGHQFVRVDISSLQCDGKFLEG